MRARRPLALLLGRKVSRLPFIDPCSTTGASLRFGFGRGSSLGAPALVRSEVVSVATATTPPGGALPDAHGESHRPPTRALLAIRQAPKPPFRGRRTSRWPGSTLSVNPCLLPSFSITRFTHPQSYQLMQFLQVGRRLGDRVYCLYALSLACLTTYAVLTGAVLTGGMWGDRTVLCRPHVQLLGDERHKCMLLC